MAAARSLRVKVRQVRGAATVARKCLDFTNTRLAFGGASAFELLRGSAVLTACSQRWLVRRCEPALTLSNRILGQRTTECLLKHTVFAHFVAGECQHSIVPKIESLSKMGVGGILDYAAEAKLDSNGDHSTETNQALCPLVLSTAAFCR